MYPRFACELVKIVSVFPEFSELEKTVNYIYYSRNFGKIWYYIIYKKFLKNSKKLLQYIMVYVSILLKVELNTASGRKGVFALVGGAYFEN